MSHRPGILTFVPLLILAACAPSPHRVNTIEGYHYSSDGSRGVTTVPDTVAFVDVLRGHYAMPEKEQAVIRAEAEKGLDEWHSFEWEARNRHDAIYRVWYHDQAARWSQRHGGNGLGNSILVLKKAADIDPSFVEAWTALGHLASQVGDWNTALEHFDRARTAAHVRGEMGRPVDHELLLSLYRGRAWVLRDLARWGEGLEATREGLEFQPGDQDLMLIHGLLLAGAGRYEDALRIAVKLPPYRFPHYNLIFYGLKKKPSSYANKWIRSQALLAQGDYDGAMWVLGDLETYSYLSLLVHSSRFWRDVGLVAELSGHPKAGLYYALGHVTREYWGFYPLTTEALGSLVLDVPDPRVPVFTSFGGRFYAGGSYLSYIALQMNRMAESELPPRRRDAAGRALRALEIAERRKIEPDVCRALRGRVYFFNDDVAGAREELMAARTAFRKAGRVDAGTSLLLGLLEMQGGRNQGAARFLEEAVAAEPDLAVGWRSLGVVYEHLGLPDRALAAMDTAVGLEPRSVTGHYNRGLFHLQHGNREQARVDLRLAARLAPENREVQRMLDLAGGPAPPVADLSSEKIVEEDFERDPEAILALLKNDIDRFFADPDSLGVDRNELQQAIVDLQRRYVADPSPDTRKILALAYIDDRRLREAQALLAPGWGVDLGPDEEVMLLYVDHLLGERERAREVAQALVDGRPTATDPHALTIAAFTVRDDPRIVPSQVNAAFLGRMSYGNARERWTSAFRFSAFMRIGHANWRGNWNAADQVMYPFPANSDPFFRALAPTAEGRAGPVGGVPREGEGK